MKGERNTSSNVAVLECLKEVSYSHYKRYKMCRLKLSRKSGGREIFLSVCQFLEISPLLSLELESQFNFPIMNLGMHKPKFSF